MESIFIGYFIILLVVAVDTDGSISALMKRKTFVDKTLIIRDICGCDREEKIKIVTAPPTFGKTVIIDMLRSFYSIQTDDSGVQISPKHTENYRLFCTQKLKICENNNYEYVSKHLGQYPVLHFDFWPLGSGKILKTFLERVSYVLHCAFLKHQYLLRNSTLWTDEEFPRRYFARITSVHNYEHLRSELEVERALSFLLDLVFRHFGKAFIVLIDNYDALFRSMAENRFEDEESVVGVVEKLYELLLVNNGHLEHAWLSGVLTVRGAGLAPGARARYYRWLGDHGFSKYYGLTEDEAMERTRAKVTAQSDYKVIQETLHLYYCGYSIVNQNTQLFNMWSVEEFCRHGMAPGLYWTYRNYRPLLRNRTQELLVKEEIHIDPNHVFVQKEIEELRLMMETGRGATDATYQLLFDLGYLTPTGSCNKTRMRMAIPNFEIQKRLCYEARKFFSVRDIKLFNKDAKWLSFSVISLLRPNKSNADLYKSLFELIRYIIANAEYQHVLKVDIPTFLLLVLGAKFPVQRGTTSRTSKREGGLGLKNVPDLLKETMDKIKTENMHQELFNKEERPCDIVVMNRHKLAIIISIQNLKSTQSKKSNYSTNRINELEEVAKNVLCKSLLFNENLFEKTIPVKMIQLKFNLTGRIYVSIAYNEVSKGTSILVYDPLHDKNPTSIQSTGYVWETEENT